MSVRNEEAYFFVVEWFDPMPRLKRKYLLKLFLERMEMEMVDLKSKKMFLKKSPCPPTVTRADFFIGGKVLLYSRELEIVDYGDLKTRDKLGFQMQQAVVLLPAEAQALWGKAITALSQIGMSLVKAKSVLVPRDVADAVCTSLGHNPRRASLLTSGAGVLVLVMQGEDGLAKAADLPSLLSSSSSSSSSSDMIDSIFVASSGVQVSELNDLLLGGSGRMLQSTVTLDSCTCCIIKPHAIKAQLLGPILEHILEQGYEVSAVSSLFMDRTQSTEFLEVYKGVVPEYADHVVEMCAGMCVALELRAENAVSTFRQTAGPWDVEMAKELRPDTIRGRFGIDRVRSAVHCTDLPTDAQAECEYVFKLLA